MSRNLMIQGTMSGAGKSILTAGILRIFTEDGFRCAPFKSQNMALNSFVTKEGHEIGRAQALQAAACRREPSADMNPILLKPMGDTASQVIVNGLPAGNMPAREYFRRKRELIPDILAAYRRLESDSDIIVIEGAGSPVEINLRENDIVNMGLAEMVDAPVLLAGNIDPGGVFAQLLGTMELLSAKERARVKGLIINKFRGDVSILTPGLEMFRRYCDVPFAGVVPWMELDLDEEDSISEKLENRFAENRENEMEMRPGVSAAGRRAQMCGTIAEKSIEMPPAISEERDIQIAVIRLPFISNYTDFDVFSRINGVHLRYVRNVKELGTPDLLILPGSKNTISDLKWMRRNGLEQAVILQNTAQHVPVIGICGGFQMLGREISDPDAEEGGGSIRGMGLLPVATVFEKGKTLRQVKKSIPPLDGYWKELRGTAVSGYEIHIGVTIGTEGNAQGAGRPLMFSASGNVFGTYLHGIFDSPDFLQKVLETVCRDAGVPAPRVLPISAAEYQDRQLSKLAGVLRTYLDMELIYKAAGIR